MLLGRGRIEPGGRGVEGQSGTRPRQRWEVVSIVGDIVRTATLAGRVTHTQAIDEQRWIVGELTIVSSQALSL